MTPYSSAREEFTGKGEVFLDANEYPSGEHNRYPDPLQKELKMALAKRNQVEPNQIFVGNGSDEIIDLLIRLVCVPGKDQIVTFVPTYGMYKVSATLNDVQTIELKMDENFQPILPSENTFWENPLNKVLILCSPNNPTGNLIETTILEKCIAQFKGLVIIDEAYIHFSTNSSLTNKLSKYPNLIVLQTLSKFFSLAGARIGIAFANPQIIAWLNKIKPPYNISSLSQQAALSELNLAEKKHIDRFNQNLESKNYLLKELKLYDAITKIWPSETNFILIETDLASEVYSHLLQQGIIIRKRKEISDNALRISIGTQEENTLLIQQLKIFYNEKSTLYR